MQNENKCYICVTKLLQMTIHIKEIDASQTRGVYANGKKVQNKTGGMFPYDFDESEILELLGEKKFKKYENGEWIFTLSKKEIFAATGDINFYTPVK